MKGNSTGKENNSSQQDSLFNNGTHNSKYDQFCTKYKIKFSSLVLEKLESIFEDIKHWQENDAQIVWTTRVQPIQKQVQGLLPLLTENDTVWSALKSVLGDLKSTKPIVAIFNEYKSVLENLRLREQSAQNKVKNAYETSPILFPLYLRDWLSVVVESGKLEGYEKLLSERGVTTLDDLDVLGVRDWDLESRAMSVFLQLQTELPWIQSTFVLFCKALALKIVEENKKDHIATLLTYVPQVTLFLKLLEEPELDVAKIKTAFDELYLFKQRVLLQEYVNQYQGHIHWKKLKEANPNMSLTAVAKIHTNINYFRLNDHLQ